MKKDVKDEALVTVSGGGCSKEMVIQSIDGAFGNKVEDPIGDSSLSFIDNIIWGEDLKGAYIPLPWSKGASLNYNGKRWSPVLAHINKGQNEVVWKSGNGDDYSYCLYLVPSSISKGGK